MNLKRLIVVVVMAVAFLIAARLARKAMDASCLYRKIELLTSKHFTPVLAVSVVSLLLAAIDLRLIALFPLGLDLPNILDAGASVCIVILLEARTTTPHCLAPMFSREVRDGLKLSTLATHLAALPEWGPLPIGAWLAHPRVILRSGLTNRIDRRAALTARRLL